MFYFEDRRRQRSNHNGKRQEESNKDHMQRLNAVKEPSYLEKNVLTAFFWLHELRNIKKKILAKSLASGLQKDGNKAILFVVLINYIWDLIKNLYIYFIYDISHELHLYEKFKETIEARNEFLNNLEIRILSSPFRHIHRWIIIHFW